MSARPHTEFAPPATLAWWQRNAVIAGGVGVIVSIIGAIFSTQTFYESYLLGYMWCWGLTVGCLAVLMLYHLTGGGWGTVARRILEAGVRTLPLMAVLFIPIIIGMRHLYPWARPDEVAGDAYLQRMAHSYLSPVFVVVRAAIYFAIWGGLAYLLDKISRRQDEPPEVNFDGRLRNISGPGIVVYGFTVTFATVDWVMSITSGWMSTIYGLLFMAGQGIVTIAFVVVIGSILVRYTPLSELWSSEQFHNQGKLLMAFTMLWGWFSFSQLLIIWSGNMPEEISWFLHRTRGGWQVWATVMVILQFFIPFALLLSRDLKENWRSLRWIALLLIVARYFDLAFIVLPSFPERRAHFHFSILEVVVPLAMAAVWLAYFFRNLRARPLLALYDAHVTVLVEKSHEHEHA